MDQNTAFKEKASCRALVIIFYLAIFGTLLSAATRKNFCSSLQKTDIFGVTGCLHKRGTEGLNIDQT